MRTYTGYRSQDAGGGLPETAVLVHEDGLPPRPLDPRLDLRSHSPTGLEWGYAGSGPAQLALALAADALGDDGRALAVYQGLKLRLVGRLPGDGWSLTDGKVCEIITQLEEERGRGRG